jgi:hypothetical protein
MQHTQINTITQVTIVETRHVQTSTLVTSSTDITKPNRIKRSLVLTEN